MFKCFYTIILVLFLIALTQAKPDQLIVPLSLPGEHGKLQIDHIKGQIQITGYSGDVVVIKASLHQDEQNKSQVSMQRIAEQAIQLNATEKNNLVTVYSNSELRIVDLEIQVPEGFDLQINSEETGEVQVQGVSGELVINNTNGNIILNKVYGPAILSTVDGSVEAHFIEITPNLPMAFTTISGKIDLYFPADTKVLLKMKSEYGEIYTDFVLDIEERKTIIEKADDKGVSKISLDEWTHARINGGGPQILIKNYHGNIFIHSIKSGISD